MAGDLPLYLSIFTAFAAIFMIKSVICNFLVIIVIVKNKAMHTTTNIFIINLAVSDIFMGGIILPQNLHDTSHVGEFDEGEFACRFVTALPILCITTSIYSLVMMAIERYRAICTKAGAMSKGTAKKLSVACWVTGILISIPTFTEYAVKTEYHEPILVTHHDEHDTGGDGDTAMYRNSTTSCGNVTGWMYGLINGMMLLLLSYIGPLIVISVSYINVSLFIHRQAKQQEAAAGSGNKSNFTLLKNKVRVIKMLSVVAVLFGMSWMPYFVLLLIAKITGRDGTDESAGAMNLIRISLSLFSVSYNMYLYIYFTASFRAGFKQLLCPCLGRGTANTVGPESTTSTTGTGTGE